MGQLAEAFVEYLARVVDEAQVAFRVFGAEPLALLCKQLLRAGHHPASIIAVIQGGEERQTTTLADGAKLTYRRVHREPPPSDLVAELFKR